MRYLGGKSRISGDISHIINHVIVNTGSCMFVSLFCGSCAVEAKVVADFKILNDAHPYLISMWEALQDGWVPPIYMSKDEYTAIKRNPHNDPPLTGFTGFGCSFGGKWFGGFCRSKDGRNYCKEASDSVLKIYSGVSSSKFLNMSYENVIVPPTSVVYCDPPYSGTSGYSVGAFDSEKFWEYARKLSTSNVVLVSEENAPDDFVPVWQKQLTRTLDSNKENMFKKVEKLFIHKCHAYPVGF